MSWDGGRGGVLSGVAAAVESKPKGKFEKLKAMLRFSRK
jgi:hypothetical protein